MPLSTAHKVISDWDFWSLTDVLTILNAVPTRPFQSPLLYSSHGNVTVRPSSRSVTCFPCLQVQPASWAKKIASSSSPSLSLLLGWGAGNRETDVQAKVLCVYTNAGSLALLLSEMATARFLCPAWSLESWREGKWWVLVGFVLVKGPSILWRDGETRWDEATREVWWDNLPARLSLLFKIWAYLLLA